MIRSYGRALDNTLIELLAREDSGVSSNSTHSSMPSSADVMPLKKSRSDVGVGEYSQEYRLGLHEEQRRVRHRAKTM